MGKQANVVALDSFFRKLSDVDHSVNNGLRRLVFYFENFVWGKI